ncbi:hypothetical protein L1S32_03730 [Methanogenium sp. S4BF]|uniref:hypothetical protein n=1 Tax=Methanogenium sp. S4BF TaxID=1789226 RepID=UPI002415F896|nr:hypothetical protein [Methanogenium sp. S4BF]WFN35241.1 hypothetical protein L1S32_03730 [Methanogenium sp. S4BF]
MHKLFNIFFEDLRVTICLLIVLAALAAFFGAIEPITEKYVQDENSKENIENIESISINGFSLLLTISGIGTVLAVIAWFAGLFDGIISMIKI